MARPPVTPVHSSSAKQMEIEGLMALKHRKQFPLHFKGVIYWIRNDEWQHKVSEPSAQGSADAVGAKGDVQLRGDPGKAHRIGVV